MSKYKRSGRPQSSRRRRTTRPCLEALESRQLLLTPATILPLPTPSPAPFAGGGNTLAGAEIEGLYHIILGRPADPAGLANWDAQLKAGESVAQIAGQFFQSPEYLNNVVESYYQTYLGRAGDPAGVASWVAQLQAGASEQQVAAAFLASPEYSATHVTDGDFVQSLYENVLGRAGDQAGINNWTQALGAGMSRGAVAASFISSPESYQRAIDADYNAFLGRAGDTAGVNSWMAQVENGSLTLAEVAAQFAGSSEYATRASQEPSPATQLVVTTPPASVTANAPFGLTVTAENQYGYVDTTYTGPVTLALSGGTSGAVLGGTVTGNAANGVAIFTGLTINTAGTGYTLTASSSTLTSATISVINVTPAPVTATKLVDTTQPPASVTANAPFGLTVTAEDGSGNIATTYTGPMTLVLSGGTSGAVLGGTVTGTAVNGVAIFTGLTINTAGTGYTLTASSGTLTPAPVTVTVTTASSTEPTEIPVISFHGIDTDPANFPYDMSLSTFTADMTALHTAGYHSITLQQYLDWEAGKNPVLPSKPILLTDDDGDATMQQMTSVLQSDGYTMVAFIVTGFIDNGDTFYVTWPELQSMVASGTWEVAFHAGADGHYYYGDSTDLPPGQTAWPTAPYFYPDIRPGETDAQYQARVTTELDQGIAELKAEIPSAYTNVFAVPFNDYGEYPPNPSSGGETQQDLTTIFDARFTIVFVEDNDFPNSVYNNNHQYRFEVHNDTTTSDLLAALNDPAFTRFGLTVALTATQVVVTTPPPASVTAGGTFSLTVTAEDDAGNVDTTYNGPVMLILNGSDATATLSGAPVGEDAGNIVDAINGVATFSNLTINEVGTGYTIDAFAVDLPGWAETDPITVT